MRHRWKMRVRFGHADPGRVVYYPRFFEWFHDTFEDFFEQVLGIHYAQVMNEMRVGFPSVQVASEFKKPIRFGELVEIEVFLSRLSERSLTFEYRVLKEEVLLATASVKVVSIDLDTWKPRNLPESIRTPFSAYVEDDSNFPDTARIR